jgi:hypothetical protein
MEFKKKREREKLENSCFHEVFNRFDFHSNSIQWVQVIQWTLMRMTAAAVAVASVL